MLEVTKDTDVYTADDKHVGSVDGVVLDPDSQKLTHLVVRKGLFFPEDKLIPFDDISTATPERINLRQDVEAGDFLPYIEHHYVPLNELDRPDTLTAPEGAFMATWYGPMAVVPTAPPEAMQDVVERNIPDRLTELQVGHPVFSSDHEIVGQLETVVANDAGMPTHFVISAEGLSPDRRAVPIDWVRDISGDAVELAANRRQVDAIVPLGPDD
jgi:sporulation protein YlmC with PRC-barrel domain